MDDKQLKVLMLIPNLGMGGAQRSFIKLAGWLSEKYSVTVIAFDDSFNNIYSSNAEVKYLAKPSGRSFFSKAINFKRRVQKLKKIKKELHPAVSISFLEGADYLNVLSGKTDKKIISIRGSKRYDPHIKGFGGWVRKKIMIPFLYKKANLIVTASKGLAQELNEDYPSLSKRVNIISNGYKIEMTDRVSKNSNYFILGWAGRFGDEKGLLELIEIYIHCHDADKRFKLLLLGNGKYKEVLESFLKKEQQRVVTCTELNEDVFKNHDIIFCDPGSRYKEYLKLFDLYILTSPSEGFPNVIIEAMQAGIPVISTDCKWGPREILELSLDYKINISYPYFGKYGVLMPLINKESKDTWKRTLLELANDKPKLNYFSMQGLKRCEHYDENLIKKEWYSLLEKIIV